MTYLDTQEVARIISQHIEDKEPFSLIRLGDGEAKLIGHPIHVSRSELNTSLRYWYGPMAPDMPQVMQLRAEMMAAVANADVVGLPNMRQEAKSRYYKLLNYLVRFYRLLSADTCHCGVHRRLQETKLLADLLFGLPSVTAITCRDVCSKLQGAFNIASVKWIWVPEEAHMGAPTKPHYPQEHSRVLRELDVGPGDVVLVGAGPNGKVYCDAAKQDGAVALDLGSVFDGFSGVLSRSYIANAPELYRL